MEINEASFDKDIVINSQEQFAKFLRYCSRNNIPVYFKMPFMSVDEYKKYTSNPNDRLKIDADYTKYYKHIGFGKFIRLNKNYVIIDTNDRNLISSDRLTINDLYQFLTDHNDLFQMIIDDEIVPFGRKQSVNNENSYEITSLDNLIKFLKGAIKNNLTVRFDMPFMKKEFYNRKTNGIDPFIYIKYQIDRSERMKYEDFGYGTLKSIIQNKYVYITPDNENLVPDMRLTFEELYNNLKNEGEDYRMFLDNHLMHISESLFEITDETLDKYFQKSMDKITDIENSIRIYDNNLTDEEREKFKPWHDRAVSVLKKRKAGTNMRNRRVIKEDNFESDRDEARRMGYRAAERGDTSKFNPNLKALMDRHRDTKHDKDISDAYKAGMDEYHDSKTVKEDVHNNQSPIDIARRMGYDAARDGKEAKFDPALRAMMNNHPGDEQRRHIYDAYLSGMDDYKEENKVNEDVHNNQSPIDIARRMGYDSARTGDYDRYDRQLRSLMNNHPGDRQRRDIHNAYIEGMDDFHKGKDVKEGKDLGKPGKNFDKIASKAAKEYGSQEAGDRVAGAVLAKLRKEHPRKYAAESEEVPGEEKITTSSKKFVIELSFNYDGDSDLADCVEDQLGKKAELNEVLRTRRIMEFDFKNADMFNAAIKTIKSLMASKGKTDYKLDSREDDDNSSKEVSTLDELKEEYNLFSGGNRSAMVVTLPFIVESLKWASKNRASERAILEYANSLASQYKKGTALDV